MMLVANKCDLHDLRAVTTAEGKRLAEEHKMTYVETSAESNLNITEVHPPSSSHVSMPQCFMHSVTCGFPSPPPPLPGLSKIWVVPRLPHYWGHCDGLMVVLVRRGRGHIDDGGCTKGEPRCELNEAHDLHCRWFLISKS